MSKDPGKLDGVIDDALGALTSGTPRDGLRARVLARVAVSDPGAPAHRRVLPFWRAHPTGVAAVAALVVLALTAALVVPRAFMRKQERPPESASETARPVATALAAPRPPESPVAIPAGTGAASRFERHRATAPLSLDMAAQVTAADEPEPDALMRIIPIPDPAPIADRPIEIAPLAIQPVVNREIQIPLIEPDRPQKGPGQTD